MADSLGASFLPGEDKQTPNIALPRAQQAIQFLSFQIPKTVGASAIAPANLLNPSTVGGGANADLAGAVVRSVLAAMGHTLPEATPPPSPGIQTPPPEMPTPSAPSPVPSPPTIPPPAAPEPPTQRSTNTGIPAAPSPPPSPIAPPAPFAPRTPEAPIAPTPFVAPPPQIIPGEPPGSPRQPEPPVAPTDEPRVPDEPTPIPTPPPFSFGGGMEPPERRTRGAF